MSCLKTREKNIHNMIGKKVCGWEIEPGESFPDRSIDRMERKEPRENKTAVLLAFTRHVSLLMG